MMRFGTLGLVGSLVFVAAGCGGAAQSGVSDDETATGGSGGTAAGGSASGGDSSSGGAGTGGFGAIGASGGATSGGAASGGTASGGSASGGGNNADDCASAPCQNGGLCTDGDNDYTCACPAGYEGKDCEVDIDDCMPNPCKNGGQCTDAVNAYACKCPEGTAGSNCDALTLPITQDMMLGTAYTSCSRIPPEFTGGVCGSDEAPGFTWTDATGVTPSSISISVAAAWNCNDLPNTPRAVYLNGVEVGSILPAGDDASTCTCNYTVVPRTVELTTTTPFVVGGVNTVTFAFASPTDCESYGANPEWDNAYGFIVLEP